MAAETASLDLARSKLDREAEGRGLLPSAWPDPLPLPEGLPPVEPFDYELLPPVLRRRVEDIAERMQCPPDFPAVAILIVLASVIGRRLGIAPKRADDWIVVPNLWGIAIGRPGSMKSPALAEAMRPLQVLEARAVKIFQRQQMEHEAGILVAAEAERVARETVRKMLKNGNRTAAEECAEEALSRKSAEPVCRRYVVNDTTVEKLGEILNENPSGVLLYRDELSGFFRSLERPGHEADRAFYLECWNGDGAFTYDRIGRGTLHIAGVCLSILGSIQPGPLSDIVRSLRGAGDDGFLQRFQLAVWPDLSPDWHNVDRPPDRDAQDGVQAVVERLDGISHRIPSAERCQKVLGNVVHGRPPLQGLDGAERLTLAQFIEDSYHPWLVANRPKGADRTLQRIATCFGEWYPKPLADITVELIERWRTDRLSAGTEPSTILRDVMTLSGLLTRAVKLSKLPENVVRRVQRPRIDRNRKVRYLDSAEEKRLREALRERDKEMQEARESANGWRRARKQDPLPVLPHYGDHLTPAVLVSMNTGIRRGELLALRWSAVDTKDKQFTIEGSTAKNQQTRHVPMNAEALEVLKQWKEQAPDGERVFPVDTGFKTAWAALLERAKIAKFRWHDLRHHFASRLVQAGVPLNTVRELLGHGSMAMTLRYAHLAPDQKREAVEKLVQP